MGRKISLLVNLLMVVLVSIFLIGCDQTTERARRLQENAAEKALKEKNASTESTGEQSAKDKQDAKEKALLKNPNF